MKPKSLPSMLLDRNSAAAEILNSQAAKYERHVDCVDHHQESLHHSGHSDRRPAVDDSSQTEKCHREIHFAFVPERYEPLIDEEAQVKAKEEKKKRKKEQYKKVKKPVSPFLADRTGQETIAFTGLSNVGKALRATWKCLMLGLYNFALGYSTPITMAATFVPDFHPGRNTT